MAKGSHGKYIIKNLTVDSFLETYDRVLSENKFKTKDSKRYDSIVKHRAILGEKARSFFKSLMPLGSMEEEGNRYGAEAMITAKDGDVQLDLLVVPYMTLFDIKDRFLISQGIFERVIDDERCKQILDAFVAQLKEHGLNLEEQLRED